jgi:hypothetical protein
MAVAMDRRRKLNVQTKADIPTTAMNHAFALAETIRAAAAAWASYYYQREAGTS